MAGKRVVLTKSMIEETVCPPGKGQLILRDAVVPGLVVRVLPGGVRSFYFIYRPLGLGRKAYPRWLKFGVFPALSLADARAAGRINAGLVAKEKDPAKQRAEERRRDRSTLSKLLGEDEAYELHLKERGLVNVKTALSSLRRGLKDHLTADVAALTRNDIVTAINALTKAGKRGAAGDLRKYARSFCEWTVAEGLAPFNVMAGFRAAGRTRQQRLQAAEPKGRALSDTEMVKVWHAAQTMQDRSDHGDKVSGAFGGLVQLALLTGMRRGELSQLQRDRHVLTGDRATEDRGIEGERLHLPRTITKTAQSHDVPLTQMMREVIAAQVQRTSPLLFPSRITGGRLKGWTKLVAQLQAASGVEVGMHDLRRTCRTLMDRCGIPEDIAELAIGHQREDLVARYNKNMAWPERVAAFEKVSAHISALLAKADDDRGNVVPLHGAGTA